MESLPVQVNLNLGHDSADDMCDMYVMETIHFDISRLREEYVAGYGSLDPIVIHVDDQTITYE